MLFTWHLRATVESRRLQIYIISNDNERVSLNSLSFCFLIYVLFCTNSWGLDHRRRTMVTSNHGVTKFMSLLCSRATEEVFLGNVNLLCHGCAAGRRMFTYEPLPVVSGFRKGKPGTRETDSVSGGNVLQLESCAEVAVGEVYRESHRSPDSNQRPGQKQEKTSSAQ